MDIIKPNVLITGASRGIGKNLVNYFLNKGYVVYQNIRNYNENKEVKIDHPNCKVAEFDVREKDSIKQYLSKVNVTKFNLVVNNAGIIRDNLFMLDNTENFNEVIDTNFLGTLNVINALSENDCLEDSVIINMASISGIFGGKGQYSYATSKNMVITFTKLIEKFTHYNKSKFKCFSVSPGPTDTEMLSEIPIEFVKKMMPLGRLLEPEDISKCIEFLMNNKNQFSNGYNLIIDGGFILSKK